MSLRIRVILLRGTTEDGSTVALHVTGSRAAEAALALAEWLSEEIPDLLDDAGVDYDRPNLN